MLSLAIEWVLNENNLEHWSGVIGVQLWPVPVKMASLCQTSRSEAEHTPGLCYDRILIQIHLGERSSLSLGHEDPLQKGMATHSSTLAWRSPWTEEPGGLQSMGSPRVRHNWVTDTFTFSLFIVPFSLSTFWVFFFFLAMKSRTSWQIGKPQNHHCILTFCSCLIVLLFCQRFNVCWAEPTSILFFSIT